MNAMKAGDVVTVKEGSYRGERGIILAMAETQVNVLLNDFRTLHTPPPKSKKNVATQIGKFFFVTILML